MTDDLVKNARTIAVAMDKTFKDSNAANTWRAVANAIENQSAELTRLRERVAELEAREVRYQEALEAYEAEIATFNERYATLEATARKLREALAEDEKALEPFAGLQVARFMTDGCRYDYRLDAAWIRRAKAALAKLRSTYDDT